MICERSRKKLNRLAEEIGLSVKIVSLLEKYKAYAIFSGSSRIFTSISRRYIEDVLRSKITVGDEQTN